MVINSMNLVETDGFTKEITLPQETAYASVLINQVDTKEMRKTASARVSIPRLCWFGVFALLLSVGMSVCAMLSFSNIFGGLFRETFAEKMLSSGWVFILPTLICAASIIGGCYMLFQRILKGEDND